MKKVTSTLAVLAALFIIAAAPANTIAGVITIGDNPCAISINPIRSTVTKIDAIAPRITNLIPTAVAQDQIANATIIEDIDIDIVDIGTI